MGCYHKDREMRKGSHLMMSSCNKSVTSATNLFFSHAKWFSYGTDNDSDNDSENDWYRISPVWETQWFD